MIGAKFKAVFFDLDGTLLDTLHDLYHCVNFILDRYGYPSVTFEKVRRSVGDGAKKLLKRVLPSGAPIEEHLKEFRAVYLDNCCDVTQVYKGVFDCLEALQKRDIKCAVITNKPYEAAEKVITHYFGEDTFAFIGGDNGDFPVKPDPALTRFGALTLRVAPSECIFVGDGEADFLTARNAGMRPLAALWGYRSFEQLYNAGAREFAGNAREILSYL